MPAHPSFARHEATKQFGGAVAAVSFTKRLFSTRPRQKRESGAPKGALSNHVRTDRQVCETRLCAAACRAARHLSALTLAALATGYYPDGSAPEPGFPRRRLTGVLPASLKNAAVKHAPCGPVLLPVDRGPRAARVRIGNSARGHRTPPSLSRHAVRNGALHKAR